MEADILEAAACGDSKKIGDILSTDGSLVNFQHHMNGWTALHWAAKRGHVDVTRLLVEKGANTSLCTTDGKVPVDFATDHCVLQLLKGDTNLRPKSEGRCKAASETRDTTEKVNFEPSYLKYPPPPTYYARNTATIDNQSNGKQPAAINHAASECNTEAELVLKVRRAHEDDTDFIEIELDMNGRTMDNLINVLCAELDITKDSILKVRKLPNTIIRKDKDVKRLVDFQEIEVVIDPHQ